MALLDLWAINRVIIIGHNVGAVVAWMFQLLHPDRVAGIESIGISDIALDQIGGSGDGLADTFLPPLMMLAKIRQIAPAIPNPWDYILHFSDEKFQQVLDTRPEHSLRSLMKSEPPTVDLFLAGEVEADRNFLSIDLERVLLAGFTVNSLATSAKVYQTIDESWLLVKSIAVIPPKPACFAIACGADPIWSSRWLDTMSERITGLFIHYEQSWTHWSIGQDSVKQSLCDKLATWCSSVDEGGQGLSPAKEVCRRCLITGATGFLGCQVFHDLLVYRLIPTLWSVASFGHKRKDFLRKINKKLFRVRPGYR